MTRARRTAITLMIAAAIASAATGVCASGIDIEPLLTFTPRAPVSLRDYSNGELGIVKPTFSLRSLVQAYRVLEGRRPIGAAALRPDVRRVGAGRKPPDEQFWAAAAPLLTAAHPEISAERSLGGYVSFTNCNDATWVSSLRALNDRIARYGARSREVADWLRAQIAVLRNCDGSDLVLPDPAPPWADSALRGDRVYQIASAYFYATQYDDAAQRFMAIANDATSSWHGYGRFLAARSMIRQATVREDGPRRDALLMQAEGDLRRVLDDRDAASVHASAEGLLHFIAARVRPRERFLEVSRRLSDSEEVTEEDVDDYVWLADAASLQPGALDAGGVTDWIATARSEPAVAAQHAMARWRETKSSAWLVAALWKLSPQDPSIAGLLDAAARVSPTSPAFATVTVYRLRALVARGEADQARRVGAAAPMNSARPGDMELVNVARAVLMRFAGTFDEFLENAPRTILSDPDSIDTPATVRIPTFDDDAAVLFSERLPLDRLIEAATSKRLPQRLRMRVAQVAFTRAILSKRYDAASRVAPILAAVAPKLRGDLARYTAATDDGGRQHAALLLFLRTPGMRLAVWGLEDNFPEPLNEPSRDYRLFENYWWCGPEYTPSSPLTAMMFGDRFPALSFLPVGEREAAERELRLLKQVPHGGDYVTSEAIAWAMADPKEPLTAEALARAVRESRFSRCDDRGETPPAGRTAGPSLSRRAFVLLHRLHPDSEWARRTRYWY